MAARVPGLQKLKLCRTGDGFAGEPPPFYRVAEMYFSGRCPGVAGLTVLNIDSALCSPGVARCRTDPPCQLPAAAGATVLQTFGENALTCENVKAIRVFGHVSGMIMFLVGDYPMDVDIGAVPSKLYSIYRFR